MGSDQKIMHCPLRYWALKEPERVLLSRASDYYIASLLDAWVEQYRWALADQGFVAGDKLLILESDPLEVLLLLFACLRSGVVFCPMNPAFPLEKVLAYFASINAKGVVKGCFQLDDPQSGLIHFCAPAKVYNGDSPTGEVLIDSKAVYTAIATSGTTGVPKAIAHTYANHYYSSVGAHACLPLDINDTYLLSLPLFHVGGLAIVFRCLLAGARMVAYEKPKGLLYHIQKKEITHLSLVNTQLYRLLEQDNVDFSCLSVRYILLGGGIASVSLLKRAKEQGVKVLTTYGMTEMSSQVCTGEPLFYDDDKHVTSGKVLPYREVKLAEDGEILVRGETLAAGQLQKGVLSRLVDEQGWYHTNDLGQWLGSDLIIKGRRDNMFISGGENIHPEEIEQALLGLTNVIQTVVVSIHSKEFGRRPLAYIKTTDGKFNASKIKEQLGQRIAAFKIPDEFRLFPDDDVYSGIKVNRWLFQQLANAG